MDFKSFAVVFIASVVLRSADAGCKDDLMAANKDCFDTYNNYLVSLSESGADSSQMANFLCNKEGQAATKCLMPLLEQCQELKDDSMYQVFSVIEQSGGCSVFGGGGPGGAGAGGECTKAYSECLTMSGNEEEADQDVANASTQFNKFQEEIKTICGELKSKFDCMKKYEEQCPGLEAQFKQMYQTGMQQSMQSGKPMPTFDSQKQFVMNECPKFPADFTTNTCLMDNLKTKQFTDCYKNATNNLKENLTCDHYKKAYDCVQTALKTCGDKHKAAFTATTNFYLAATFKDECKVGKSETSGAPIFFHSLYIITIGVLLSVFV